jgi:hypothetical protein
MMTLSPRFGVVLSTVTMVMDEPRVRTESERYHRLAIDGNNADRSTDPQKPKKAWVVECHSGSKISNTLIIKDIGLNV